MTSVSTGTMSESDTRVASKEAAALVSAFYESLARGLGSRTRLRWSRSNPRGRMYMSSSERRNGHGATEA